MKIFLDILCTCLWWLTQYVTPMKDIEITLYSKVYFKPEPGNVWNRWRFLKKLFVFFEELNRRIRENGWNFGLPWIRIFKNISPLPSHFTFFLDFSHLFSDSDNFFRDPWVPLTFFRAATFAVNHFPMKIREQNIVLTQHSAKAHTNPLSKKRKLSHARGTHATSTFCRICWERYYFLLWVFLVEKGGKVTFPSWMVASSQKVSPKFEQVSLQLQAKPAWQGQKREGDGEREKISRFPFLPMLYHFTQAAGSVFAGCWIFHG